MGAMCSYFDEDMCKCIKCGDDYTKQSSKRRHCREHRTISNNRCIDCDIDIAKYSHNCYHIPLFR